MTDVFIRKGNVETATGSREVDLKTKGESYFQIKECLKLPLAALIRNQPLAKS